DRSYPPRAPALVVVRVPTQTRADAAPPPPRHIRADRLDITAVESDRPRPVMEGDDAHARIRGPRQVGVAEGKLTRRRELIAVEHRDVGAGGVEAEIARLGAARRRREQGRQALQALAPPHPLRARDPPA